MPEENSDWLSRADQYVRHDDWEGGGFGGSAFGSAGFYEAPRAASRSETRSVSTASGFTASNPSAGLTLKKGDSIKHRTFGRGLVISVRPMGGDALIEVAFDDVGTKKLMLKAAGAHIEKL